MIVHSVAPIRVCDNGGWTDTWFARHGSIFNIAVYPFAAVQIRTAPLRGPRITIHAENYGETYCHEPLQGAYDKHPLLEAAFDFMRLPEDVSLEVSIHCDAPAGCSTGTSAAVSVALVGGLDHLTGGSMSALEVAAAAQRIETEVLGRQCGIQDQLASAMGGINYIEMPEYPRAEVHPVIIPDPLWWELEGRLSLVFVGDSHSSSAVHDMVIASLTPDSPRLDALRRTAPASRDALVAGEFATFGRAMIDNTEAQRDLHPELIGVHHQRIIDIAREAGAIGWKVNGAGGDGGSVTLLSGPDRAAKRAMLRTVEQENPRYRHIPIHLARRGLRRWESVGE